MAARAKAQKLTARPARAAAPAPVAGVSGAEISEFPDALVYINSLSAEREGIEWNVKVYDATGTGGRGNTARPAFLFEIPIEDLPQLEARLAEAYEGGGDFRVHIRADNVLQKNVTLPIAPRPGYKAPPPSYLARVAPINPQAEIPPADVGGGLAQLGRLILESQQQTRELIAAMAAKAPPVLTFAEQMQQFKQMQEMLPQGQQQNGLDMFEKGMAFYEKIVEARGGSEGGTTMLDLLRDAINSPNVKEIIAGAIQGAAAAQPQRIASPPAPAPQEQPADLIDRRNPQAAFMMQHLLAAAASKADPKLVGEQILEIAPPILLDALSQHDDIPAYIIQQFPEAAEHRAWLAAVVADIWPESDIVAAPTQPSAPANDISKSPPGQLPQV